MNFEIKSEPAECFILPTNEKSCPALPSSHLENISNGFVKTEIKQEPNEGDNSDFEVEYLDEDSEAEYMQDTSQGHNSESNNSGENRQVMPANVKQARTSIAQMQMLSEYMNKKIKDKDKYSDEAMRILTEELNKIGPPVRTSMQWRRTWSILKYNNKRNKRRSNLYKDEGLKRVRVLDQSDDTDATLPTYSKAYDANEEDIPNAKDDFHSRILETMNSVLQQQTKQTKQLERLNNNLEKLIAVMTDKIT